MISYNCAFFAIEKSLNQWLLWKGTPAQEDTEKRCVRQIDVTMNIPEDAVKQCGSLVALR